MKKFQMILKESVTNIIEKKKNNFLAKSKDCEKSLKNNLSGALNILFINNLDGNTIEIKQAYIYKYD